MYEIYEGIETPISNKKATFVLACCVTKTCNIDGITQAGIPGMIELTPTLDSELIYTGKVFSLPNMAETPKGVPTPAIITRAISEIVEFDSMEFLDLGYTKKPQIDAKIHSFGIHASDSIDNGANIDAKAIFDKGREFGKSYECRDYIILAETTPSGTTTAEATARALGYECEGMFASTFVNRPSIKQDVIAKALSNIDNTDTTFDKLSKVSDNMIIFNAGFLLEVSKHTKIVLAGGTQMASVLLTLNTLAKELDQEVNSANISLFTTKWIAQDKSSNIEMLISQLEFEIGLYYADFDFELTDHPALKLYDNGDAKEGVGAGAALCYAYLNGATKEQITKAIERQLG
jgi:uncharacterized protein (TIGR00303 family)